MIKLNKLEFLKIVKIIVLQSIFLDNEIVKKKLNDLFSDKEKKHRFKFISRNNVEKKVYSFLNIILNIVKKLNNLDSLPIKDAVLKLPIIRNDLIKVLNEYLSNEYPIVKKILDNIDEPLNILSKLQKQLLIIFYLINY